MDTGKIFFINNMKRLLCIILFSAGALQTPSGSVCGISFQDPDPLNGNKLLKVARFSLEIIPPSSGVQFYRDGIVFLYNTRNEANMLESHTSFGKTEAYYAVHRDSSVSNQEIFSQSSSWNVPAEAMTFSSDYSVMYYTKRPSNKEPEKIYKAKYQVLKNGKSEWVSESKPLSFCTGKSVYSHPALSADGEKMVFTSDRSEGAGGLDLFITYKEGDDWSSPINLGNLINTRGNELSPFLDQENNLFFSSDGIGGLGGYDIYLCRYNGRGWDKPANLTRLINTPDDELAFTLNRSDGKSAFYTTRFKNGNRPPQLFKVIFLDQPAAQKLSNLSNAFKYITQTVLTPAEEIIPVAQKQAEAAPPAAREAVSEPVKPQPVAETRQEPARIPEQKPLAETSDETIFRVQFLSTSKPRGSNSIKVGGQTYKTYEYLSNGTYRSYAGEFPSPAEARNLQTIMRQQGYPDAFIVAFRNNERVTGSDLTASKSKEQAAGKTDVKPAQTQKLPEARQEPVKPTIEKAAPAADAIVYRVQFSSSTKSRGSFEITIGGKKYNTFEYMYNSAYRACAGEFSTSAAAASLQKQLKQEGYPDAFVIATRGKERLTDPSLFRK